MFRKTRLYVPDAISSGSPPGRIAPSDPQRTFLLRASGSPDRTPLYLMQRRPFIPSGSAASDVNAPWSDVVCEVTTSRNAFQRPARTHRAGKSNVPEIKNVTVRRRAQQLRETPG